MHAHMHTHACIHTHMHTYMHTFGARTRAHAHTCICTHTNVHVHTHAPTQMCMCTNTHGRTSLGGKGSRSTHKTPSSSPEVYTGESSFDHYERSVHTQSPRSPSPEYSASQACSQGSSVAFQRRTGCRDCLRFFSRPFTMPRKDYVIAAGDCKDGGDTNLKISGLFDRQF